MILACISLKNIFQTSYRSQRVLYVVSRAVPRCTVSDLCVIGPVNKTFFLQSLPKNVWLLTCGQILGLPVTPISEFLTSVGGLQLLVSKCLGQHGHDGT